MTRLPSIFSGRPLYVGPAQLDEGNKNKAGSAEERAMATDFLVAGALSNDVETVRESLKKGGNLKEVLKIPAEMVGSFHFPDLSKLLSRALIARPEGLEAGGINLVRAARGGQRHILAFPVHEVKASIGSLDEEADLSRAVARAKAQEAMRAQDFSPEAVAYFEKNKGPRVLTRRHQHKASALVGGKDFAALREEARVKAHAALAAQDFTPHTAAARQRQKTADSSPTAG